MIGGSGSTSHSHCDLGQPFRGRRFPKRVAIFNRRTKVAAICGTGWQRLRMDQIVSVRPRDRLFKLAKAVGLILGGTSIVALLIGWTAFLLWLAAEIVVALVHWL